LWSAATQLPLWLRRDAVLERRRPAGWPGVIVARGISA
jgi:hypothetical protein